MTNKLISAKFVSDTIGLLYDTEYYKVTPEEIRDALSSGQLNSKIWLAEKILEHCQGKFNNRVHIAGGWIGTLANIIRQFNSHLSWIKSFDINPNCAIAAEHINKDDQYFTAFTADMYELDYGNLANQLVINTSCEHIPDVRGWLDLLVQGTMVCLQSNNMVYVEDHVNCSSNIDEFKMKCNLSEVIYSGTLKLHSDYERYMIIGKT